MACYHVNDVSKAKETKIIRNSTDAGNYLLPYFLDEPDEIVMMLCLDNKRAVICCREMGRGVVNCVDANIRRMVETALKVKTKSSSASYTHLAPTGLKASSITSEGAKLSWKSRGSGLAYRLTVATKSSFADAKTYLVKGTSKTVKGLLGAKTYYARVKY